MPGNKLKPYDFIFSMKYTVEIRKPEPSEFNTLRELAGWPVLDLAITKKGLANSLFGVCVFDADHTLIGMGRIVGDDAIYLHISDVIVHPGCQRKGIGRIIMTELMKYVDSVAAKNTNVGLMCSQGREEFYAEFGFTERPNEKFGAGMIMIK
jgi:ribosomal protein S18 acetylase RimI-like enzyme